MTHLANFIVAAALTVGAFTVGQMQHFPQAPEPPKGNTQTCLPHQVEATFWKGTDRAVRGCLNPEDIDPNVYHFAEEVASQPR